MGQMNRTDCNSALKKKKKISNANQISLLETDIVQTHHHGLQLHAVGWNNAAAVLERLLQVLLTHFRDACHKAHDRVTRAWSMRTAGFYSLR